MLCNNPLFNPHSLRGLVGGGRYMIRFFSNEVCLQGKIHHVLRVDYIPTGMSCCISRLFTSLK